jgi:CheY-like chemotaxis protein
MNQKPALRMLIADNDDISRKVLRHFVKKYGEIVEAIDGDDAWTKYTQAFDSPTPFTLLFLDNVMPGKTGGELVEAVRAHEESKGITRENRVAIMMLTGTASPDQVDRLQRLGIDYYLLKPFEEDKLLRELRRLGLIEDPDDSWG